MVVTRSNAPEDRHSPKPRGTFEPGEIPQGFGLCLSSGALAGILRLAMVVGTVIGWILLAASAAELSPRKYSPSERMQTAHLKATHEDALRLQQDRRTLPSLSRLHDYKAILHAHAEDSAHTGGTRTEIQSRAAKMALVLVRTFAATTFTSPAKHLNRERAIRSTWRSGTHGRASSSPRRPSLTPIRLLKRSAG